MCWGFQPLDIHIFNPNNRSNSPGSTLHKPLHIPTYLNCGEFVAEASEASVDSPGSCGKDAEWCNEFVVEVDDGREIGSTKGIECRPSSLCCAVLKDSRSRACSLEEWRCSMGEALKGASVEAVIAVVKVYYVAFKGERKGRRLWNVWLSSDIIRRVMLDLWISR
jgi:hypothetical protein